MFIIFAPHVGVEFDGVVGSLGAITSKGVFNVAAVGAFKQLMKQQTEPGLRRQAADYFDAQINFIKLKLAQRLDEVADAPGAYAYLTYQMYAIVREFFCDELLAAPFDFATGVTVLGGIMIVAVWAATVSCLSCSSRARQRRGHVIILRRSLARLRGRRWKTCLPGRASVSSTTTWINAQPITSSVTTRSSNVPG